MLEGLQFTRIFILNSNKISVYSSETHRSFGDLVPVLFVFSVGSFEFEHLEDASTSMDPGVEGVTGECLQL